MSQSTAQLRPYQVDGVRFLTEHRRRAAFLADDPGLGKSAQFLTYVASHKQTRTNAPVRVLVLAPAIGRVSWRIEGAKWLPAGWRVEVIGKSTITRPSEPRVLYVASYDSTVVTEGVGAWIMAQQWTFLGLDEAHYLKSPEAKRTRFVYGARCGGFEDRASLVGRVTHAVVAMSGTPTPNHAGEIWTHLSALVPERLPGALRSRVAFENAYCKVRETIYGRQITGSRNQDDLREKCRGFLLRRMKRDVLRELPSVQVVDHPVELTADEETRAAVFGPMLPGDVVLPEDEDQLIELLRANATNAAAARRAFGVLKAKPAARWVRDRLENGVHKIIVFAHHRDVLDILERELVEFTPVRVDGSVTAGEREMAVEAFQSSDNVRVFLGQIQAAGTAITLTAAHEVVMVEADWTPANNDQAISRAHRMGQKNGVLATFLFLPDTLDQRVMRAFRRKAAETAKLYD